jgi:C-terminal processing protease CtpA/Prc
LLNSRKNSDKNLDELREDLIGSTFGMKSEKQALSLILFFMMAIFILVESFCKPAPDSLEIQNLRAFAKLYGYVRYFHPSDEASLVDWDKFVILGVEKVKDAANAQELISILEGLFLPVAPTIQIYLKDNEPEDPPPIMPEDTQGLHVVAWQHRGLGSGSANSPYVSKRLNREIVLKPPMPGVLTQGIDAKDLRGKEIRLRVYVKAQVEGPGNHGLLWLRVDRENKQIGFFDNMGDRPILSDKWAEYEIKGRVDEDALMIFFGSILNGTGNLWLDDFRLLALSGDNQWEPVSIDNPGFEMDEEGQKPKYWGAQGQGYRYEVQKQSSPVGEKCLSIESMGQKITGPLFDKHPEVGDMVERDLASGLACRVPLALYADESGTLGKWQEYFFDDLVSDLKTKDFGNLTADNGFVRLADVIIAWNVFQHFYPYFDVVEVDWDRELTDALKSALEDKTERDFFFTLSRMVAKLQDGHGNVYHNIWMQQAGLPIKVDWIENEVVVTVSQDPVHFQLGDIILEIDGIGAEKALLNAEEYISGSPQWKRWKSLNRFGYGEPGTTAKLKLKRNNGIVEIETVRDFKGNLTEPKKSNIEELDNNIYYVNLDKASWNEINARIEDLARAKGVIFDLRGYPNGNHQIIRHLLEKNDTSDAWMQIPLIVYPDQKNIAGYQKMGWGLVAREPHIQGKAVFIVYGGCISYAESFMSFIEHYNLAEIVGKPTAGTNGNINSFMLPGGFRIIWTGMRVLKHDGSQHHLIGIQPTVLAERTIKGVIEGRDEFLEKAIEILNR